MGTDCSQHVPLSDLTERVLADVDTIPSGTVTTYGDIARRVGCGARHVGSIMRRYGALTAWWRVVRADGTLAVADGTLAVADRAIEHWDRENIVHNGKRVDLSQCYYQP
ncbi:methylated-DNA--protein-cysteine methyltransferase [Corynebacterium diphtheriae]|nr:methylated-DNA--protein-cysteine methyltransferase [Corynebacterium diphtheriae]CAB0487038.1 methylated-DNA--protein-cysteine methyltransferase [Corynebacterium diphtheriae]